MQTELCFGNIFPPIADGIPTFIYTSTSNAVAGKYGIVTGAPNPNYLVRIIGLDKGPQVSCIAQISPSIVDENVRDLGTFEIFLDFRSLHPILCLYDGWLSSIKEKKQAGAGEVPTC